MLNSQPRVSHRPQRTHRWKKISLISHPARHPNERTREASDAVSTDVLCVLLPFSYNPVAQADQTISWLLDVFSTVFLAWSHGVQQRPVVKDGG